MTALFAEAGLRLQIEAIVHNVYETMLGITAIPAADPAGLLKAELTAAVYYVGTWKGAVILECSTVQAMNWASRLMSVPPPVSLDDAGDGLGEVTNIVAGNVKPLLPPGAGLSIPSVVEGANYKLRLLGEHQAEAIVFDDGTGPFRITLVQVSEDGT